MERASIRLTSAAIDDTARPVFYTRILPAGQAELRAEQTDFQCQSAGRMYTLTTPHLRAIDGTPPVLSTLPVAISPLWSYFLQGENGSSVGTGIISFLPAIGCSIQSLSFRRSHRWVRQAGAFIRA